MLKRFWLLGLAAAALAGCGGGGGDGSVGVGQGQDPDPVAPDFPIAYTKGPLFDEDDALQASTDLRDVQRFNVGTDLYMRDRASPTAVERNITFRETQGLGDVQGVEISVDGRRILFAMRGPVDEGLDLDDPEQPHWGIWEYTIATDTLRRLITADITFEAGHDVSPHYLPDGRIIFSSTRQRQSKAILLDENKPQFEAFDEDRNEPAYLLHVMSDTGDASDLRQVSFNQSDDFEPVVLDNGKIMFSRWDHAGNNNGIHLYQMNPDGSELELLYGAESHLTGTNNGQVQFIGAREMQDGRIMAIVRPFDHPELGGAITIIDAETYVENTQSIAQFPGMTGPAQIAATPNQVRTDDLPSQGGRFSSAFPLWDGTGRVLVSWAICRLQQPDPADPTLDVLVPCTDELLAEPDAESAPPLYGIWMYDPVSQTQRPIVIGEEDVLIGEVVAAQPRSNPDNIADKVAGVDLDADLVNAGVGILNIKSVYDMDGVASVNIAAVADPQATTAAQRPARFLRVEKAVSIPDEDIVDLDDTAFGPNVAQGMREIVAYAPIEPDGSVRVKVPARVALAVSVLDANGRRISSRHQNWIQVMPGQELDVQRLSRAVDQPVARPRLRVQRRVRRRERHGRAVSEHAAGLLARRRRHDGRGALAGRGFDSRSAACDAARVPTETIDRAERESQLLRRVDQPRGARARRVVLVRLYGAHDAGSGRRELHRVVDAELPDRDQLRAEHPPALERAARGDRSDDDGSGDAHVLAGRLPCAGERGGRSRSCRPGSSTSRTACRRTRLTQFNAYRELLFADNRQVLMNGALVDEQVVDRHGCDGQSDHGARLDRLRDERGRCACFDEVLLAFRRGRESRRAAEHRGAAARRGVARHRRAVLQQPLCDDGMPGQLKLCARFCSY